MFVSDRVRLFPVSYTRIINAWKVIQINALKAIPASGERNDKALVTQNVLITRETSALSAKR
jgi:hypothetical protein